MKTIVYGSYLVYYTDDKDRFIKCNKIDRGDTQGFRFIPDYVKHLETQLKQKEDELAEAREIIEECLSRTADGNFKYFIRKKLKEKGE